MKGSKTLEKTYPSASQRADIREADAAMRDSHIDISLGPVLGLKTINLQPILDGIFVVCHPTFETTRGRWVWAYCSHDSFGSEFTMDNS